MRNNMKTYFTSDWHIGHFNVLQFFGRPFRNLEDMHQGLITRYNATVRSQDVCFFLGDMGTFNDQLFSVVNQLNGTKILLLGNHDKTISSWIQKFKF